MLMRKLARAIIACLPSHYLKQAARNAWLSTNYAIANDMRFEVEPSTFWDNFNRGRWEPETFEFYRDHVSPQKDVIDIGGWIGPTTLLAYAFNARHVFVVEADPANYQVLKRNSRKNFMDDRVSLHNICVSNRSGDIVNFGAAAKKKGSSTKRIGYGDTKVVTTDIDDFIGQFDLNEVSIVKIDIEGAEQDIVGVLDTIAPYPGIAVLFSIHTPLWRDAKTTSGEIVEKLAMYDVFSDTGAPLTVAEAASKLNKGGYFCLIAKTRA